MCLAAALLLLAVCVVGAAVAAAAPVCEGGACYVDLLPAAPAVFDGMAPGLAAPAVAGLGASGNAPVRWIEMPELNRGAPRPAEFANFDWYWKRGRVTVWGRESEACRIAGIDPEVEKAVQASIALYEKLGARIREVSLPHTEYAVAVYYIIATAEASANLARYDGVRFGKRADDPRNLLDMYVRTRSEGFGEEVKRRIILGTYVLSSGYYDAYYLRAQKVRTLIRQDFTRAFEKVDALICPTSPEAAFKIGERSGDPLKMYLADIFTIAANLAGNCGISLPCGFANVEGSRLPVGLQLLGKPMEEAQLLSIAHAYEQSTPWHKERPTL
jgi:Asp-tRNA(Asn)/Glu-tRNA(Gln) amidotransferase A subunit family amidase